MTTQQRKLKVVLEELESGVMVGVMATGCDPHMTILQAGIADLLEPLVAKQVEAANHHWAQQPKNPTYQRPPEPKATPPRTSPSARGSRRQPEATQQQLM